jgi:hypothetical protein
VPLIIAWGQAHGSKFINNYWLKYFAYTGHFNEGGSSGFISDSKFQWSFPGHIATLGGSYQNGVRTLPTIITTFLVST